MWIRFYEEAFSNIQGSKTSDLFSSLQKRGRNTRSGIQNFTNTKLHITKFLGLASKCNWKNNRLFPEIMKMFMKLKGWYITVQGAAVKFGKYLEPSFKT
jgi:hypothetical protein